MPCWRTSTAPNLNPLEEAAAYQQLLDEFGVTHDELASRDRSHSRPQISQRDPPPAPADPGTAAGGAPGCCPPVTPERCCPWRGARRTAGGVGRADCGGGSVGARHREEAVTPGQPERPERSAAHRTQADPDTGSAGRCRTALSTRLRYPGDRQFGQTLGQDRAWKGIRHWSTICSGIVELMNSAKQ